MLGSLELVTHLTSSSGKVSTQTLKCKKSMKLCTLNSGLFYLPPLRSPAHCPDVKPWVTSFTISNYSGKYLLVQTKKIPFCWILNHVVQKYPLYICTLLHLFHRHSFFIIVHLLYCFSEILFLVANSPRKAMFIFFTGFLSTKIHVLKKRKWTYDLFSLGKNLIFFIFPSFTNSLELEPPYCLIWNLSFLPSYSFLFYILISREVTTGYFPPPTSCLISEEFIWTPIEIRVSI